MAIRWLLTLALLYTNAAFAHTENQPTGIDSIQKIVSAWLKRNKPVTCTVYAQAYSGKLQYLISCDGNVVFNGYASGIEGELTQYQAWAHNAITVIAPLMKESNLNAGNIAENGDRFTLIGIYQRP